MQQAEEAYNGGMNSGFLSTLNEEWNGIYIKSHLKKDKANKK